MNARDHDLAQPAVADVPAITGPATPPRRDLVEDADPSFTRKRPRLDSGSNSIRALSADPEPSTRTAFSPREQQVEMTIRSHPPSSPVPAAVDQDHNANGLPKHLQNLSPILIGSIEDESVSPPVMVIEDDDDSALGFSVQIDAEDYFRQFPYAHLGSYAQVTHDLPQYIQGSTPIDGQLFPLLSEWLEDLPDPSVDIQGFYISKTVFWDEFGVVINKLLVRRYPFGEHFDDDIHTAQIFDRFLGAYVRICSFLLQVDAYLLSRSPTNEIYPLPLLSQKHMRALHNTIRFDKAPFFHVLHKEYGTDVREMNIRLQHHFLRANGAQNLLQLADRAFHRLPPHVQNTHAIHTSQILSTLGWTIFELPGANTYMDRSDFHRGALSFFQKYGSDLQDPSRPIDASVARDLIHHCFTLVGELCQWDESIAAELVDQLLDFGDNSPSTVLSATDPAIIPSNDYRQDPTCYPTLVANAWKFKILRKYVIRGNMGLRVMSIATMDAALVEIWRESSRLDPSCRHPVMQYLAEFLLQGQVVDYIVSVDSHPQLISRSGNIAGFLIVTHRWSEDQADAIWRTVSTSPDPRVVEATMTMLRGIIGLMKPADHLYLCTKLHNLPINRYTPDILRFLRDLTGKLRDNVQAIDYDETEHRAPPWNVCIRVLRDTAPSREADKNLLDLHLDAFDQLMCLSTTIPPDERETIYRDCVQQIAERSVNATGNYRVICFLIQSPHARDTAFIQENPDLMHTVLEGIPRFVEEEAEAGFYPCQIQALYYRLDLLRSIISHNGMDVPSDLYKDLWDHTVGDQALSNDARDQAWALLLQGIKVSPDDEFCNQLVLSYIPTIQPEYYTNGLFEFVASYNFPTTREKVQTEHGDDSVLQIPGASLLWPIILSSPTDIIEDRAASLLAARYVQVVEIEGIMLSEVENAHIALVEQCMQELRAAIAALPKHSRASIQMEEICESKDDTTAQETSEVRIQRILLFQKLLLEYVRRKPQFNRGQRTDSKVDTMETDVPTGDNITVRYQCGNDRQRVTMATDHTLDDLYRRLCHATGFTKINLFARGQRLKVFEKAAVRLSDIDLGGQVIVQRADGAELSRPLPELAAGSSVFEVAIVKRFDELFSWMDSADTTSCLLFDFLTSFPARSNFADSVARDEVTSEELFPPGKVFQARYAAQALQTRLREQIRNSTMSEIFLINAIQRLVRALLNTKLISESFSRPQELELAVVLVDVLLEFLRERPRPEISAGYFYDESSFVDRLMTLVLIALETPNFTTAAQDSYATILEASLHSRIIWEAFTRHADVNRVHRMLLLAQPEQASREHVARKIISICGGDLPSTCPVTKPEIASRLWIIISAILPEVMQYPRQSEQLFEIAEHVFRINDEYDRNEERLRSSLGQWSSLLLEHEHKEFPGRDEVDHVVLGLTKLLLCCILSIKSFKKPVNAGSLMTQVFRKYIFVTSTRTEREIPGTVPLPILESHTRQELYDLMLGLAEDSNTYDTLLQLTGEVENDEIGPLLSPNLVDRSMEIRSSTGYVGLYNPRAICYMNSLLTQLFMNVNFRQFMLGLDVKEASGSQRLLFETQRLFAQMQNSFRRSTDPRSFAACVKSLDKTPIDITVQMDADEFYNLLFDQWEGQLLTQEHKEKFRSFYGGQTLNQIKSKECEHVSERAEPFFAVQCDIAGKATLQDSLQAYVQGDVMEGDNKYKCETCDGKFVDAVKRTCLKDAPDNLIFHLKRFEFDLNDFSRRKIYDHFAFPISLDISPYKIDHLADLSKPREEDWYDLVGVLVHTGTCENGHYYSYIRERPSLNGSTSPAWIEFNDSDVGPFDPAEIAERTFGGFTVEGDGYVRQTKQFSAYMLFYQRRTAVDEDQCRWVTTSSDHASQIKIPKALDEETNVNNELFIREYSLFDPVHERFLRQLHAISRTIHHGTCSETHDQEKRALHIVLAHLGHVAWRQYNVEIFLDLLLQLRRSMLSCTMCCKIALQWLAIDDHSVTNILVKCSHPKIRSEARALFIAGLKYLREKDPALYGIDGADSDMEVDSIGPTECVLLAITQRLRTTANETMESTRGWEDYYLMLTQMAAMGPTETAMLLNSGFLHFCLKLFCMNAHPPFRNESSELARIMEKRRGIFNRLICFLWTLLSQMDLSLPAIDDSQSHDRQATMDPERMKFPLSKKERPVLVWWSDDLKAIAVLDKILETFDDTKVDHFYPGDIVGWMLDTPDVVTQTHLCRTMTEGVQLDPPYCNAYIRAALPFCEACPKGDNISKVINAIAKAIASPTRAAEDRLPGGLHVVRFLDGLLKAENEILFERRHPHAFHHLLMLRSRAYAIPLLCHYDDAVRKESSTFFEQLYDNEDAIPPETVLVKYTTAREVLSDLMLKFAYEKEVGRNRSFLVPMVDTCRLFVRLLYVLSQSQAPETQQFQDVNDTALIYQFQQEVEARMRSWPHDEGTPISQGEAFEQSEYGSESDEAHDLLDN